MNGVRAELNEWNEGECKGRRVKGGLKRRERGRGGIAEWMALFMRTGFHSDVAATLNWSKEERNDTGDAQMNRRTRRGSMTEREIKSRIFFLFLNYAPSKHRPGHMSLSFILI